MSGGFEAFMAEFREFKRNTEKDLTEIKEHLKEQNGALLSFTKTCSERGVKIQRLEEDVNYLREKMSKKADKQDIGTSNREKAAIGGSYILQIILEILRRIWPI